MQIKNKTIVITGANRGMGRVFCERIASEKPDIILVNRKIDLELEMTKAIHLLGKKYRQQNLNDIKVKAKAVRFLAGKGFSEDCIMESLSQFQTNTANDLE